MSGANEILLIAAVVVGIFLFPRMMPAKRQSHRQLQITKLPLIMTAKFRLAIAASVIYPVAAAAYFQPWKNELVLFLYLGIGPVALCWLLYWVVAGRKR